MITFLFFGVFFFIKSCFSQLDVLYHTARREYRWTHYIEIPIYHYRTISRQEISWSTETTDLNRLYIRPFLPEDFGKLFKLHIFV